MHTLKCRQGRPGFIGNRLSCHATTNQVIQAIISIGAYEFSLRRALRLDWAGGLHLQGACTLRSQMVASRPSLQ